MTKKKDKTPSPQPPEKNPELSLTNSDDNSASGNPPGKTLDEMRSELTAPPVAGSEKEKEKAKIGRPSNKDKEAGITAIVETGVELPFMVSRMITNWPGFVINPEMRPQLMELAKQVYRDFGPEFLNKWIVLFLFTALWGTSILAPWLEYLAIRKAEAEKAEAAAKAKKAGEKLAPEPEKKGDGKPAKTAE